MTKAGKSIFFYRYETCWPQHRSRSSSAVAARSSSAAY